MEPFPNPHQPPLFPAQKAGLSRGLLWVLVSFGLVVAVVLVSIGLILITSPKSLSIGGNGATPSSYVAPIPGPGCDTRGGIWKNEYETQTSCLSDRVQVTAPIVGDIDFLGTTKSNNFPQNYEVGVDVFPFDTLDGGIVVHQTAQNQHTVGGGYEFGIDSSGAWFLYKRYGDSQLPFGNVPAAAHYHLDVTVQGTTVTLTINDKQVNQFTNIGLTGGDSIGLIAHTGNAKTPASFKDFVFKALPQTV